MCIRDRYQRRVHGEEINPGSKDVIQHYSSVANAEVNTEFSKKIASSFGYSEEELAQIPPEANMGLGCGNSVSYARPYLKKGSKLLDLGCGAGMDLYLASPLVGDEGKACGVDLSKDMIEKGKKICEKYGYKNVEFHYSSIEKMPFDDGTFDVVISNCVLNLVPDKIAAFEEIYRILKPGGNFIVSDILLKKDLPNDLSQNVTSVVSCIGKAIREDLYREGLEIAGFSQIEIVDEKRDLMTYFQGSDCNDGGFCGVKNLETAGNCNFKEELKVIQKYNVNDYGMACMIKATK
eukprot:TRINITY_DN1374_c0_g1_i1.p1 TRINITY_DN1374_c0_g1~~TRINITY_DN1374_c0_g1_i1.p1  ORF type:complete len:292 (-),score=83.00 TRINITY_DN1374_c0_g1_i1:63-938(-)